MFPSIFTLGIEGLGPLTGEGSGMLITAIVGGAIIPLVQGIIADMGSTMRFSCRRSVTCTLCFSRSRACRGADRVVTDNGMFDTSRRLRFAAGLF